MSLGQFDKAVIVSEDSIVFYMLKNCLTRIGFLDIINIKKFSEFSNYLKKLTNHPKIIIIDIIMYDYKKKFFTDFFEPYLKKKEENIAIIYMTELKNRDNYKKLEDAGCFNLLLKPLNENIIEKKIMFLLEKELNVTKDLEILIYLRDLIEKNEYTQALNLLLPILKKYPSSVQFQTIYAEILYDQKEIEAAHNAIEKALKMDPNYLAAINLSAKIYISEGQYHKVEKITKNRTYSVNEQKELEKHKNQAELNRRIERVKSLNAKALILIKENKYKEILPLYEESLVISEGLDFYYQVLFNAASGYYKNKELERSLVLINKCIDEAPSTYQKAFKLKTEIILALEKIKKEAAEQAEKEAKKEAEKEAEKTIYNVDLSIDNNCMLFFDDKNIYNNESQVVTEKIEEITNKTNVSEGNDVSEKERILRFVMFLN